VRLRKCDGAGWNEGEDVLEEREREHVWREAVFCRGIMVPLLGDCYIQPPTAAQMDRAEVRRLDQMLRTQRPGNHMLVAHLLGGHFGVADTRLVGGWELVSFWIRSTLTRSVNPFVGSIAKVIRRCIQKFPDRSPGARTANGSALCH
jgi:hypothetical protein